MHNFTPFAGRQKELRWLNQHLEEALNYNGGSVLIKGEIGVGKTRLLNQFVESIEARNLHILHGRVIKNEVRPFSPFTQMIEYYLCNLEDNRPWLVKFLEPEIAPFFIHLIPELKNHYPLDMPDLAYPVDNLSFAYSLQRFFENLSKSKPLVVILDDIQWMSGESIAVLKYLVKRIIDQPILLAATLRSHEDNLELQQTIDEFNTDRIVFNISLANFSRSETEKCLYQKFEGSLPNHFIKWLFTITEGNPLFIEEILKTLIRQNIIHQVDANNEWQVEEDYSEFRISETVESVINYRLGNLAASELKLMQGAAVIGEIFNPEILHKLLGSIPKDQFLRSNNILISSGMIIESGDMQQFAHPLIHALLYQKMKISERRKLHRRLAEILKNLNAGDEEIIFHMTKDVLASEETEELACYLFKTSMDLVHSSYNYPTAWKYLHTAKRIAEKIPLKGKQRLKIKAEFNYLSWMMGKNELSFKKTEQFITELIDNDLNKEASATCRILFHAALNTQDIDRAEEFFEKGISLLKIHDSFYWTFAVEHCLLQRRKGLLTESELEAKRLSREIPQKTAPEALYKVFTNLGLVFYLKGNNKQAHQYLTRARKIVEEQHLLLHTGDSSSNLGLVEMTLGKLGPAQKKFNDSIREAELLHREPLIGINLLYLGCLFSYKGEHERAIEFFERTEKIAEEITNPRLKFTSLKSKAKEFLNMNDTETAESIVRGIPLDRISKQVHCDIQTIKSTIHLMRNELELAEKSIDESLKLAEKYHFETLYGIALGKKALILLHKDMQPEALSCVETVKTKLLLKGDMPAMSEILINFGLFMGGSQGEAIFIEGLEMLFYMGASARISSLYEVIKKKNSFNDALKLIREKMDDIIAEKIEISTFDGLSVKRPGELSAVSNKEWQSRKSQELFAMILVQSGSHGTTREILASHLWPETTEKKSQLNMRVALAHLNRVLGNNAVLQDGPFLKLNKELIQTDLWTFDSLVKEWQNLKQRGKFHPAEDRARRAVNLYKGYFLPEFYSLPVVDKQDELENRMRELLFWLATRCMERVEWQEAILFSQRLLILDACNEQACRIIMQGLYYQGDRTGAIRQFERLSKYLKSEFDTTPSPETIKLHEEISVID